MAIYLDHAATTPLHPDVMEAMTEAMSTTYGNPSSIHQYGRQAKAAMGKARRAIASSLHASAEEIVFTSGGTEADNLAIIGAASALKEKGRHIITTTIEHKAVLNACQYLEENGFNVTYVPVDETGHVAVDDVMGAIQPDTILVSIMFGNNEVGTVQPIADIGQRLREQDIVFHTDAVQAVGKRALHVNELAVDLLSGSAHKIHGPKGVGFLYIREKTPIKPLLYGGKQERIHRAGTENVPGVVGLGQAMALAQAQLAVNDDTLRSLRQTFLETLRDNDVSFTINGPTEKDAMLPNILNISFPGIKSEALVMRLDLEGVLASVGSACTSGAIEPSHVLNAMYPEETERVQSAIRFSFGVTNTLDEVERAATTTAALVNKMA